MDIEGSIHLLVQAQFILTAFVITIGKNNERKSKL